MTIKPLDFDNIKTYSVFERPSKVGVSDLAGKIRKGMGMKEFFNILPNQLASKDLLELIERIKKAKEKNKFILVGMGAHVIKVGLNPVFITLMEHGLINGIALNGACIVHDTELSMAGKTSEDVGAHLGEGLFGMARETGEFINYAINLAAKEDKGLGETLGREILKSDFPYKDLSLIAQARKNNIPVTVHVAIGTDIIHIHPQAKGENIGMASFHDFRLFCGMIAELDAGIFLHFGSAVILPEVFLKAITVVRNLGHNVRNITTANFDFIRQYRPGVNVVSRPTQDGGKGYNFTCHHELIIPLLACGILEETT
jgi:deoxyhypusine synthase